MARLSELVDLPKEDWERLQEVLTRFEQALRETDVVALEPFLPSASDPLRAVALRELVKRDLEVCWRKGRRVLVETYLKQFADLEQDRKHLPELLHEEYRIRQKYGDKPPLAGYQVRFPQYFHALEERVQDAFGTLPATRQQEVSPPPPKPFQPAAASSDSVAEGHLQAASGGVLPVGGYTLRSPIGRGQFGEVWRAEAPGGIDVAIKIIFRPLHHAEAKRELDSLEAIKLLRHPFLLRTQAFWALADRLLIAMELADGNLSDREQECKKAGLNGIPMEELLKYFCEASEAIDYLHSKNVLHRDIKPDNILIVERHAKLADFGLARILENQRSVNSMTMGTPAFMAPEVWQGHYSIHCDQYSLAATYAFMRLQRPLYESRDLARLMMDCIGKVPDLSPLPEAEQNVILKALAKKPEERYANCLQFFEAVREAVGQQVPRSSAGPVAGETHESASVSTLPLATTTNPPTARPGDRAAAESGTAASPAAAGISNTDLWSKQAAAPRSRRGVLLAAGILFALFLAAGVLGTLHFWPSVNLAPKDYQRDDGATVVTVEGKKLYDRIVRVLPGGVRVVFLLISPRDPRDPPAFYIMQDKVSNAVFQAFVDANPDLVKDQAWQKGAEVVDKANPQGRDIGTKDGRLPVFRVTVEEAHQCALWLGGDLPTTREWLTAAGRHVEGAIGPFMCKIEDLKPNEIAINRENNGPMPIGEAVKDVSPRGCRDMAGNGREWTRTIATKDTPEDDDVQVPLPLPAGRPSPEIWLLGQTYEAEKPMRFDDAPDKEPYGKPPNLAREHYVSFRVVIKIPAQP